MEAMWGFLLGSRSLLSAGESGEEPGEADDYCRLMQNYKIKQNCNALLT